MAFITVEGEVSRINRTGNGFGLKETWKGREGREGVKYWSVFPDDAANVQVGDRVKVNGGLTTKVGEPKIGSDGQERRFVEHTVNRAKVEAPGRQANTPAAPAPAPADTFPPTTYGDDTPF